ncbi:M56 family metallopeptidase [Lacinutrix undariae]
MDYLLKASAVIALFFVCYKLFLQRETFFNHNRWFLITGLVLACIIPFIIIPIYVEYTPTPIQVNTLFTATEATFTPETPFDYMQLLSGVYMVGVAVLFVKFIIDLISLRKLMRSGTKTIHGEFTHIETNKNHLPFSFFKWIVYNPTQFKTQELQDIITHEKAHASHFHSIDIMLSQLVTILFWFNPIVWFYKKSIAQNLEFIADEKAQQHVTSTKDYQLLLLKTNASQLQSSITTNFYTSLIKKRIVMLQKSKSNPKNIYKYALILPMLAFFLMSFNTETIYVEVQKDKVSETKNVTTELTMVITKDTTDEMLEKFSAIAKKQDIIIEFKNVKRNSDNEITSITSKWKSKTGKGTWKSKTNEPIAPFRFFSNENETGFGNVSDHSKILEKNHNIKSISYSENSFNTSSTDSIYLTTTKVKLNSEDNEDTNIIAIENGKINPVKTTEGEQPLYIVDGKKTDEKTISNINVNDIESVTVLKDKAAIKVYGTDGKNGVIIITTKTSPSDDVIMYEDIDGHIVVIGENAEEYIFVLDGKIITKQELEATPLENIKSVETIKADVAKKLYGQAAKHGAFVLKTKIEKGTKNPWNGGVSKVTEFIITTDFSEDKDSETTQEATSIDSFTFLITKTLNDNDLKRLKTLIKDELELDFEYSQLKRNKAGEITKLKLMLSDGKGKKSSAAFKNSDGIPDINVGKSNTGLILSSED